MIRAVFDANVLASGFAGLSRESTSPPAELLRRWLLGHFTLIVSTPILAELEEDAFSDPYFQSILPEAARWAVFSSLRHDAVTTELTVTVQGVAPDPDDDHVLAAAVSSQARHIVTGDRLLQSVGSYQGVEIVSPRAFLEMLENQTG